MWDSFRKYHYLSHDLSPASQCYCATYKNNPIAFCAVIHFPHPKANNIKMIHRLVVLPDYQGVGVGVRLLNEVAKVYARKKYKVRIVTTTPSMIAGLSKSKMWICDKSGHASPCAKSTKKGMAKSHDRLTTSWEFVNE